MPMMKRTNHSVEKEGTGIEAREANGNHSIVWLRANITQDVYVEQGSSGCPAWVTIGSPGTIRGAAWR